MLNLRENNSDKKKIAAVNGKLGEVITLYEIPLDTGDITEQDLYKILEVVRDAPKPHWLNCSVYTAKYLLELHKEIA